jgi:putative two-component system response regulator
MTLKILIVDDEPSGLQTAEAILDGHGYILEFAASGAEALEKAREFLPDVILLDVMMPGMSGFEVCAEIRKDEVLSEVAVFFITALDDRQSLVKALGLGADEFITKPYDPEELRARLIGLTWSNRHLQA